MDGRTALHRAASQGDVAIIKSLIAAGADVRATDAKMRTPLHEAVADGHIAAVELLLLKGARADVADSELITPLLLAARMNMGRGDGKLLSLLEYYNQNRTFHCLNAR